MLSQNWKLARLHMVLLAVCTLGRLSMGAFGIPYERGHHIFSLVTMTIYACIFYGAFMRRWRGSRIDQVVLLTAMLGFATQLVILVATSASFALGVSTYFNDPRPLGSTEPVTLGVAMLRRLGGLVANTILSGIVGGIGWCFGPLLPERT
jgi:hypothetical protein